MVLAFHKPYGVLSQFTQETPDHHTLAEFGFPLRTYPIGRLDWDSEGLLLLSDEKKWNDLLLNPRQAHEKTYHVQVEGWPTPDAILRLERGVTIQDYDTKPCHARLLPDPGYPARFVPIRVRLSVPTSWIEIKLTEGKNRQVRRMTAAIGHPTLRLIRVAIGTLRLDDLAPGIWQELNSMELMEIQNFRKLLFLFTEQSL